MAVFVAIDYTVTVNGVNLSDHVTAVDLPIEVDGVETTSMGGGGWRSRVGGLKQASVTIAFNQDFAASNVDATIWPLVGTTTVVVVKPTSGAVSATNPSYTATVLVTGFSPINGSVGDLATMNVTWPTSGAVTRTTT